MTEFKETELDERAIKMAKVRRPTRLSRAGHGHPGSPVSLAPIAYTLYQHFIKHDPNDPNWEGRDRFILLAVMLPSPSTSSCTSPATA